MAQQQPEAPPSAGRRAPGIAGQTHTNGTEPPLQHAALDWIREHETLAVLGAFALGVFLGSLMRG